VALEIADGHGESAPYRCSFVAGGLHIRLGVTKTDQEGRGAVIAVPRGKTKLCPVAALRVWLELSQISRGPIFREVDRHGRVGQTALTDRAVADIVKRAVVRAGLDPLQFSGHSLRAGFVTSAAQAGVTTELIMRQTRHRKAETVAGYVREAELFSRNAASKVGL
jgi:integrase